ncbi:MAG: hypothetical protein KF732_01400 [Flavobacteriales bacterium]|nr:hypothetical protein [Flavobacteriales bacterium]
MKLKELGQKKIPKWFAWGGSLLFIIYAFYDVLTKQNELETYGINSSAKIIDINPGNKGVRNIEFEFNINNKTYTGYGQIPWLTCLPCEVKDDGCIGTYINIIYSKRDPEIVETNYSDDLIRIEDQDASEMWNFLKKKVKGE